MKNKKSATEPRDSFRETFNALIPPIEEANDEEVANLLSTYGIDPEAISAKARQHLQEVARRRYSSQGKTIPAGLKNALRQLKPPTVAQKVELEASRAKAAIRSILEEVKEKTSAAAERIHPTVAPQPAFRNKKDITDADRKQLADLQAELDEKGDTTPRKHTDSE
jgi:hypothetical protein